MADVFLRPGQASPSDVGLVSVGDGIASVMGVESPSALGIVVGSGDANALPDGVVATSALGAVVESAGATIAVAGVAGTSALGTIVASADSSIAVAGVQAASTVGTTVATGGASATPLGVESPSAVGTVVATGEGGGEATAPVIQAPERIVGTTADLPGGTVLYRSYDPADDDPFIAPPLSIDAAAYPMGVSARGEVGRVIASGSANIAVDGVAAQMTSGRVRPFGAKNPTDDELISILLAA